MERSTKFNSFLIKSLVLVALLALAGLHTAKADALTPTASGAGCTGLTGNPDPTNTNVICFTGLSVSATNSGVPLGPPAATIDTLFLYTPDSSNLSLALICTSSCFPTVGGFTGNSAELFGSQAFGGTIGSPTTAGSSCVIESHTWSQCVGFTGSSDFVQGGTGGNHGGDPADTFALITTGGGNFDINSASIDLKFNLGSTSTPEPSSLLMLGSGLLGLLGLGLRRSSIV